MTVNKLISIMAGFMVTLGLALAHLNGQVDLSSPSWLWLCAFVGLNLFQSGFTGFCPAGKIFKALGIKEDGNSCCV
ncbi:MAG: hypothetical protein RLZ36_163 [Pseudomonadota bacterium]|jgi:ribose/xylose/arabinose/galactoside ABC-type transport system permease subunit|uniref:Inner membrane protein YgaP-like transmembrane domain-containing protein n=1 Tax=Limnohabitans curvus TaxID=323423 RepID=A0A315G3Q3_9BURK|nr:MULTISPECIES: DUF2892 domain-containing protein [Limnohabitans]PUE56293.1 hypothetical protein B9Z36_11755 [Limnohabitans sp. Rim8]PUE60337.1 hypothetical protein B9Z44_12600 [Limnohabitans curvus]